MERTLQLRPIRLLRWLAAPVLVFAALLLLFTLLNRSSDPASEATAPPAADLGTPTGTGASADTRSRIAGYRAAIAADPADAESLAALGNAYHQLAQESGNPAFNDRADEAYARSLANDPQQFTAVSGLATLTLARHEFADGLELAKQAHSLEPDLLAPYPALIDAQIEMGRYEQAAQTLERLISLKPTLAAYARISYFRELNGDLPGALQAMRLATSAGSGSAADQAYVQNLTGDLQVDLGRYELAERSYRGALAVNPGDETALVGLANIAAGRGDFEPAIRRLRRLAGTAAVPEFTIPLAEAEEAAGMTELAQRDYALAAMGISVHGAEGENVDTERGLYEAHHGDPATAVELTRSGWQAAPSVRAADALSWALHRAGNDAAASRWSAEAMKLGSRDPLFMYHAGMIARADGRAADAERLLGLLVEQSPRFNPLYGPRAERALEALR